LKILTGIGKNHSLIQSNWLCFKKGLTSEKSDIYQISVLIIKLLQSQSMVSLLLPDNSDYKIAKHKKHPSAKPQMDVS